jgi:peptidoglycan/xylan/chitin deacetylase (PgdA/CDA1 family)
MILTQNSRLVLNFHGIGPKPIWVGSDEAAYWCDDPATFETILDSIPHASKVTRRPVELTFDDGNLSDFTIGAKALAKRGLTASFFVCAGRIGQPNYLDRVVLSDMIASGQKIGSHGWSHIDWRKADDTTLEREVNGAKQEIENIIGQTIDSVAVPFGSYDRRVLDKLSEFTTIYTSDQGLASPSARIVPRVSYKEGWAEGNLLRSLLGENALKRIQRSLRMTIKRLR